MALTDKLKAIGDAIREKTGKTDLIPLDQMPQEIESIEAETYYDLFWDTYQQNGERTEYNSAFVRDYWTVENFKPKYDLEVTNGTQMFYYNTGLINVNLKQLLNDLGIELKTSNLTNAMGMFQNSRFSHIPTLDFRNVTTTSDCFSACINTKEIEKILVSETTPFSRTFNTMNSLEEIRFEGVVGQNGLNFQWSTKLSRESIESIINALSPTTTGLTVTLSKTAKENVFSDEEWSVLIATKPNWTISLI